MLCLGQGGRGGQETEREHVGDLLPPKRPRGRAPPPPGLAESSPCTVSAEASWGHGRVLQAAGPTALQ